MDIGLEKLIEMIEQRLGRLAGNVLLGLVVLAVVGVSLHLINEYLVTPIMYGVSAFYAWAASIATHAHRPNLPNLPAQLKFPLKWIVIAIFEIPALLIFVVL